MTNETLFAVLTILVCVYAVARVVRAVAWVLGFAAELIESRLDRSYWDDYHGRMFDHEREDISR